MKRFPLNLTQLIHENLSVVMSFAYSRKPLTDLMEDHFIGEWKYLWKALFEISESRATEACFKLALYLRTVDDDEEITVITNKLKLYQPDCGKLFLQDGSEKALTFREACNKIIHSAHTQWDFSRKSPSLICHGRDDEKSWVRAEVDIRGIAAICGQLMS